MLEINCDMCKKMGYLTQNRIAVFIMLDIIIACFCRTTFKTKHCIHHVQVHVAKLRSAI